jgi:hypothetical protein
MKYVFFISVMHAMEKFVKGKAVNAIYIFCYPEVDFFCVFSFAFLEGRESRQRTQVIHINNGCCVSIST